VFCEQSVVSLQNFNTWPMFDQIIKVVACRETGCYWYFIIIFAESLCKQQIFSLPQGVTTVHIFSSISAAYLQHTFSLPQRVTTVHIFSSISAAYLQHIFSLPQRVTTVHISSSISAANQQHISSLPQGSNHCAAYQQHISSISAA